MKLGIKLGLFNLSLGILGLVAVYIMVMTVLSCGEELSVPAAALRNEFRKSDFENSSPS